MTENHTKTLEINKTICAALTPIRLLIIEAIAGGANTFNLLINSTGLTRPNLSNHIKILEDSGFVVQDRKERRPVKNNTRILKLTATKFTLTLLGD